MKSMMNRNLQSAVPGNDILGPHERSINKFGAAAQEQQISPEFAAQIVKQYILPMFESDNKKDLKIKYNKMSSIAGGGKSKLSPKKLPGTLEKMAGNKSVYGELKLSEQLA